MKKINRIAPTMMNLRVWF